VGYHRGELKRSVKSLLRQTKPSPMLVTLVFIAVASIVPYVIEWLISSPTAILSDFNTMEKILNSNDWSLISAYLDSRAETGAGINTLISIFLTLFTVVIEFGYLGYCLKLVRGEGTAIGDLFDSFGRAGWIILLYLLVTVFMFLWAMLIFMAAGAIIGIISIFLGSTAISVFVVMAVVVCIAAVVLFIWVVLRYAMVPFVFLDSPEINVLEVIRRSKLMMRGQKQKLFVLGLSFIGWYLLALLIFAAVFGVGMFLIQSGNFLTDALNTKAVFYLLLVVVIVAYLVSMPLILWIQPYAVGCLAQFYRLISEQDTHNSPQNHSKPGEDPTLRNHTPRRLLSDYEPKPRSSAPGYDPEKHAPKSKPESGENRTSSDQREDERPR